MDLLLWRHAEAEAEAGAGLPDLSRELTDRGQRQARRMAAWLTRHQPERLKVLCSPAMRTRQTADAFTDHYEIVSALAPDAHPDALIAASGWPDSAAPILIVGHQPTLGRLASQLLSGIDAEWSVKKGALWWFSHRVRADSAQTVLRCVIHPGML